jgi:membrane protease YdiL (CAAX protease family)
VAKKPEPKQSFIHRHSLSIVCIAILILWIVLYSVSSPKTHLGSFYGNAIADWTGLVVTVLATKFMYEQGSAESRRPPGGWFGPIRHRLRNHSLTIFLAITGIAWVALFASLDSEAKWGQVVGNIVSEWTQIVGLVLLTKKLIEAGSKESRR